MTLIAFLQESIGKVHFVYFENSLLLKFEKLIIITIIYLGKANDALILLNPDSILLVHLAN
jgi:hypothetical protein